MAELPSPGGRAGATLAGAVDDDTGLLRHPTARERSAVVHYPRLEVHGARAVEAATVRVAEGIDPPAHVAAAGNGAGTVPGETTFQVGDEEEPGRVPFALEDAGVDQRGDPADPPVLFAWSGRQRPEDVSRSDGTVRAHRPAPVLPSAAELTAARMSAQRECR